MTTPYANFPITDSSGRKYADRGITLPQLLPGAFKEMNRRRAVPACIVLPHSLLCSFFHISVFHSNLRQAGDLQTEGCRHLSVILTFHLLRWLTRLYANHPITDSPWRKCVDRGLPLPQHLPNAIIWSSYFGVLFSLSLAHFCKYLLFEPIHETSNYRLLTVR